MTFVPGTQVKPETKQYPAGGYTLLELVITLSVLAIMVMGTIPIAQNAVKRQKEERLRESLRMMRDAIDEFKRDTIGACPQGAIRSGNPAGTGIGAGNGGGNPLGGGQIQGQINVGGGNVPADPRSRVVIDDCTIFDTENLDRYPPSLDVLMNGVTVRPRGLGANMVGGRGLGNDTTQATDINGDTDEVKKVYLREIPVDPMTGEKDWNIRSSYQGPGSSSWDNINVFDVRSASNEEALNGEKYSEW